jgi:O-succinylbenzoic acid--CoA ligase
VGRILRSPGGREALARCAQIFIGGAPVSSDLRSRLDGLPITLTYGMTETAGGCIFNGVPAPGVGVTIDPRDNRITVNGPTVAIGYYPDTSFAGEFRTSDVGTLIDGTLTVTGRVDDVIIVKGTNVSLNAVTEALSAACHELAPSSEVCVVSVDHPEDGAVICVAASGLNDADLTQAIAKVRERLGSAATPQRSRVMGALPQLPGGKIDRLTIAQLFEEQ